MIGSYCAGCGHPFRPSSIEPKALSLQQAPTARVVLGGLLICLLPDGGLETVDLWQWRKLDLTRLSHPLHGDRPVVLRGVLLSPGPDALVAYDLWHHYAHRGPDRSCVLSLHGEMASEVVKIGAATVSVVSKGAHECRLLGFEVGSTRVERSFTLKLPGAHLEAFAGLAPIANKILVGQPNSSLVWSVKKGVARPVALPVRLTHDAFRLGAGEVIAAGSEGELIALDGRPELVKRILAPALAPPMLDWDASPEWAVLCQASWVRAVHLESQRAFTIRLPQRLGVRPSFHDSTAYLASDEGSLYSMTLSEFGCRITDYQPVFLGPGGTPVPPWVGEDYMICFGGAGELVRLQTRTRKSWTPVMFSDIR